MMTKIFVVLIAVFLFLGESSKAQPSCRSLFRTQLQGYFKVDRQSDQKINFILTDRHYLQFENRIVGTIEYDYFSSSNKLLIEWIHVDKSLENLGISSQLIQEALVSNPDTSSVTAYLTDSNYLVYQQSLSHKKSSLEAVKSTPFYKAFANLGFSKLVSFEEHDGRVIVLIQRDKK